MQHVLPSLKRGFFASVIFKCKMFSEADFKSQDNSNCTDPAFEKIVSEYLLNTPRTMLGITFDIAAVWCNIG